MGHNLLFFIYFFCITEQNTTFSTAQYNTEHYSAEQYNTIQKTTMQYRTISTEHYQQYNRTLQGSKVQYDTEYYNAVKWTTVQNTTKQYNLKQFITLEYSTVQWSPSAEADLYPDILTYR